MVENFEEPLWSRGKSMKQLRQICRTLGVSAPEQYKRKDIVNVCDYMQKYPDTKLEVLKHKCGDPNITDKDDLVKCVVEKRVKSWSDIRTKKYGNLKCGTGEIIPSVENDTFNDCPMFHRVNDDTGCCKKSMQAKFKAVANVARATHSFRSILKVPSRERMISEMEKTTLTPKEKTKMMEEYETGSRSLDEWIRSDISPLGEREKAVIMTIMSTSQRIFTQNMKEYLDEFMTNQDNNREDDQGLFSWMVKGALRGLWGALKMLANAGISLLWFITTNPHTAKIMGIVIKKVKKRMCRQLSIQLGHITYIETRKVTMGETVAKEIKNVGSYAKEMLPGLISKWTSGSGYDKAYDSTIGAAMGTLGGLSASVLSSIPGIGGAVNFMTNQVNEVMKESMRLGLEVAMYEKDLTESFGILIEIMDISDCIAVQEVERIKGEAEKDDTPRLPTPDKKPDVSEMPGYQYVAMPKPKQREKFPWE